MNAVAATRPLALHFAEEFPRSRELFQRALSVFPDGVTHDLRRLTPFPIYVDRAEGAYKLDVDGHKLIDYWSGHGAILLGHSHPEVVAAIKAQAARATHPGACHELEILWAEQVCSLIPSAEKVRFTASGTEATLMALRLARIHTGKPKILKFAGHFHGWHDFVIPGADGPLSDNPVPGIPLEVMNQTVVIPPNDLALVERTLKTDPSIGCIILEPTGGHWGTVPIRKPFLAGLRELTRLLGIVLIFDEVITGFRVSPGGAQGHHHIIPDISVLAKILAGGLPGGCVAGHGDLMAHLETRPDKPKMMHPGTFNANPLSAAAGIATLKRVATGEPCRAANESGRRLRAKLNALFKERKAKWAAYGAFSFWKLLPNYTGPAPDSDDFAPYGGSFEKLEISRDPNLVHSFRQAMLLNGVDVFGLGGMTSACHVEDDLDVTVKAVANSLDLLEKEGLD